MLMVHLEETEAISLTIIEIRKLDYELEKIRWLFPAKWRSLAAKLHASVLPSNHMFHF